MCQQYNTSCKWNLSKFQSYKKLKGIKCCDNLFKKNKIRIGGYSVITIVNNYTDIIEHLIEKW